MSKLNVDQQSIGKLFSDRKTNFLIPDYQRPYAWGEEECQTLWDDIKDFAFPDNNSSNFDPDNEYFLGPIVTFNNNKRMEVIDGQQRLTTFMLILRAFYDHFLKMKDEDSVNLAKDLAKCIWKIDELEKPIFDCLKIDSEVATDENKEEFISILKTGKVPEKPKSAYAKNYKFFCDKIQEFKDSYVSYFVLFPRRILNNCILLPIEADSQDTALRIFSTLNDRGKPLSDSDIFKAQMYRYFSDKGQKKEFIDKWKKLENICNTAFEGNKDNTLDEVFTRYMYFQRAKQNIKLNTTEALRKFYENGGDYAVLKNDYAIDDLIDLAYFWKDVKIQEQNRFSNKVLKQLSTLENGPNGMWTHLVSVYYMTNRNEDGSLDEIEFCKFLDICIAFMFAYAIDNPGVNSLRGPAYAEMINIVNKTPVTFSEYKIDRNILKAKIDAFTFSNIKPVTRSFVTWWAYQDQDQPLLQAEAKFDIEHIYAKQRNEIDSLSNQRNIESLGNKSLLEERINIRAADYKFADKKRYYLGFTTSNGQKKEGTSISELKKVADMTDFTEEDIIARNSRIVKAFMEYLESQELLKG